MVSSRWGIGIGLIKFQSSSVSTFPGDVVFFHLIAIRWGGQEFLHVLAGWADAPLIIISVFSDEHRRADLIASSSLVSSFLPGLLLGWPESFVSMS
jgi:hypothetical protein